MSLRCNTVGLKCYLKEKLGYRNLQEYSNLEKKGSMCKSVKTKMMHLFLLSLQFAYIKPRNLLATLIFQVQGKYSILTEKNVLMSSCESIALLRNSKDKILI